MKTFSDLKFATNSACSATCADLEFNNGFGVSVMRGILSYSRGDTYWMSVTHNRGRLHSQNPVARGFIRSYLSRDEVTTLMAEIQGWHGSQTWAEPKGGWHDHASAQAPETL